MKKIILQLIIPFCLLILFFLWYYFLRPYREKKLEAEANDIIIKIEQYAQLNDTLPSNLLVLGINDTNDSFPFYYETFDCNNYILSYGLSIDESKTYYSDSKKWEYGYREIKTDSCN